MIQERGKEIRRLHTSPRDQIRGMTFDSHDPEKFHCHRYRSICTTTDDGKTWGVTPLEEPIKSDLVTSYRGKPLAIMVRSGAKLHVYLPGREPENSTLQN